MNRHATGARWAAAAAVFSLLILGALAGGAALADGAAGCGLPIRE